MALLRITAPDSYQGNQQVYKADRLLFHAAMNDLIQIAKYNVVIGAGNEYHVNAKNGIFMNVSGSSKIIFGKPGAERSTIQPNILGASAYELLDDILQLITTLKIHTPMGTAVVAQDSVNTVIDLQKKYLQPGSEQYILSDLVFTADNVKTKS